MDPSLIKRRVTYTRGYFSLVSLMYGKVLSSRSRMLKRGFHCLMRLFSSASASLLLSTRMYSTSRASEISVPVLTSASRSSEK